MSQLVLLTGFLASKPESSTTDGGATITTFDLRARENGRSHLWHAKTYLDSARRVLHATEMGAPVSVAGLFHVEVFREPKVKLRYQVDVRQVIALRPIAPANEGSEQ